MTVTTRRGFVLGATAMTLATAACDNSVGSTSGATIDARADAALQFLESNYPGTVDLRQNAAGMLIMPLITEAGFGVGAGYGEGVLRIDGVSVDFYSVTAASFGFQIGAQQFSQVLYFMTQEALSDFRTSAGWTAGADVTYAFNDQGQTLLTDTNVLTSPIIAVVFGQAGLIAGATVQGSKYNRILR
jgi:lipid-binding SYLF domain-containing protein